MVPHRDPLLRRAALGLLIACGGSPAPGEDDGSTSDGESTAATSSASTTASTSASASASTTASTSMSSSGSDTTSAGTSEATSTGTTGFTLEVHTLLADGRLALECNLPAAVADCPDGAPCDDLDEDELNDLWEEIVIDRFRPLRRMDEAEMFPSDAGATAGDVGRVTAGPVDGYRVFVMLGWSRDYGSCAGFTAHDGDSERVALDLEVYSDGGPGGVAVRGAYTAAHEGTISDAGRLFTGDDLDLLQFDADTETAEPRWVVFPSANKHATYGSVEICEGISMVPCIDEDCAEGDDLFPDFVHAGEDAARIVDDLGPLGFPGDSAWADQDFCGGQGGSNCSASVREKLLNDPF